MVSATPGYWLWRNINWCKRPFYLGGGLGIFSDRDQRSIFLGFEFRKSVFFLVLIIGTVFFRYWSLMLYFFEWLNKRCILKCFIFSTVFFLSSSIHQVLQ